jgi:hypothetical protein
MRYIFECGKDVSYFELNEWGGTFISRDWLVKSI